MITYDSTIHGVASKTCPRPIYTPVSVSFDSKLEHWPLRTSEFSSLVDLSNCSTATTQKAHSGFRAKTVGYHKTIDYGLFTRLPSEPRIQDRFANQFSENLVNQLLVSVRDLDEAQTVARFPVGILDVKEPSRGALGAADPSTLLDIWSNFGEQLPLSFSAGELSDRVEIGKPPLNRQLELQYESSLANFAFIKIGLARMADRPDWQTHWRQLFENLPQATSPVAVAYFDYRFCGAPSPARVIKLAASHHNCSTILFDTYHKTGDLFSYIENDDLTKLIDRARRFELTTVIAGSISKRCLPNVVAVRPDYIGVRGAVCNGDRVDKICGRLVGELLNDIQSPIKI